jgi:hypothetical protein
VTRRTPRQQLAELLRWIAATLDPDQAIALNVHIDAGSPEQIHELDKRIVAAVRRARAEDIF